MKPLRSVQFKIGALLLGAVVIASIINAWHGMRATSRALTEAASTDLATSVAADSKHLESGFRLAVTDLEIVMETPPVQGLLRALDNKGRDPVDDSTKEQWVGRMEIIFSGVLRARPQYAKLYYILADGEELASVSVRDGVPVPVPKDARRPRADSPWFRGAMKLPPRDVFASEIALRRDPNGQIELPANPIIHYAMPVYKEGKPRGTLVIAVLAQHILKELKDRSRSDARSTVLVDRNGTYLVNPDARKEWGTDLGTGESFRKDFPQAADQVLSGETGVIQHQGHFLAFRPVHPKPGDPNQFWVEVQLAPEQTVLAAVSEFRQVALALLAGSIVVTMFVGVVLIWRMIARPLQQTARVLEGVAAGDLAQQVPVESGDEVGRMGQALNRAIDSLRRAAESEKQLTERERSHAQELQQKVDSILNVVSAAAAGDLTREISVRGSDSVGRVGDGLAGFLTGLRGHIGRIADTAQTLAGASQELTAVSQQMTSHAQAAATQAHAASATAEQVSQNVSTVSTATHEMGASIREIAKSAHEAAKVATGGVRLAQQTNATVAKLGDSSGEIGDVVKVITSIAQQTNLLALNATIEAARAGEAGKGFAVVANEVKELAKQTARATSDIERKVEAIQVDTRGAVEAIDQIGRVINQINDLQNTIATAVEEQTATTAEIGRNVDEAAHGSRGIARNVAGVAESARVATEGAGETKRSADELARLASDLQKLVAQFKY
jgi:methyl-accepting chemotaxis protein